VGGYWLRELIKGFGKFDLRKMMRSPVVTQGVGNSLSADSMLAEYFMHG
jgi:hypothetical protein